MQRIAVLLSLAVCLAGCGSLLLDDPGSDATEPGTDDGSGARCGADASWEDFGAGFFAQRCATCHTAAKSGGDRLGAPAGIDFDTEEQVLLQRAAVRETVLVAGSMPPGLPLASCEKQLLASFLDGAACVPQCDGRVCGDDGCGGSCGGCADGLSCRSDGQCVGPACTPDCTGRVCGDDGCGGSCGSCAAGQICNSRDGVCSDSCTPDCTGKVCGDDGCGGVCGTCGSGQSCDAGRCSTQSKSLSGDVMPIFTASCTSGCHSGSRPSDGLDLSSAGAAWRGLVNVRSGCGGKTLVVPGSAATSYLIAKVGGGGSYCGSKMPGGSVADLSAAQIEVIRSWIAGGAQNN